MKGSQKRLVFFNPLHSHRLQRDGTHSKISQGEGEGHPHLMCLLPCDHCVQLFDLCQRAGTSFREIESKSASSGPVSTFQVQCPNPVTRRPLLQCLNYGSRKHVALFSCGFRLKLQKAPFRSCPEFDV